MKLRDVSSVVLILRCSGSAQDGPLTTFSTESAKETSTTRCQFGAEEMSETLQITERSELPELPTRLMQQPYVPATKASDRP